uniref:TFIIS N-terminal domain-containing protein n=1 Tax=Oryza glumipatula TaxID=40148 RepID=A0A0E0B1A4_9ORYZ
MQVVYKAISLMQRWKVLLSKERDREALNVLLEKLKAKMESLRPVNVLPDNINRVMFGFLPKAGLTLMQ